MGCVASKRNINDLHPNMFHVVNIDDMGNRLSGGHLEVTETDLVLYQKNKSPVSWPLKSLRRYGCDEELFSFESGRRAPTGPGIFAFRCRRAEQLFNQLQAQFTAEENATLNATPQTPDPSELGYLEPQPRTVIIRHHQVGSTRGRVDSIGSSGIGPLSPPPTTPPSPPPPAIPPMPTQSASDLTPDSALLHMKEEREELDDDSDVYDDSNNNEHLYINSAAIETARLSPTRMEELILQAPSAVSPVAPYMNVDMDGCTPLSPSYSSEKICSLATSDGATPDGELQRDHVYMNVVPGLENVLAAEQVVPPLGVSIIAKPVPGVTLPFRLESHGLTTGPLLRGKPLAKLVIGSDSELIEQRCSYANMDPPDREVNSPSSVVTPPPFPVRSVNYAVLDLDQQPSSPATSVTPTGSAPVQPESPQASTTTGYATIDFNKTVALSHSVNPNIDYDREGCRKTRHNSTINDLLPNMDSNEK